MNNPAKPRPCPCGSAVAAWRECPAANKAGLCKSCCQKFLLVVADVAMLKNQVEKLETTQS